MSDTVLLELLRVSTIHLPADDDDAWVEITFDNGTVKFNLRKEDNNYYGGEFSLSLATLDGLLYAATLTRQGGGHALGET